MLSDWDIYKNDADVIVAIEPISPLVGPGSLRLAQPGGLSPTSLANLVSKGVTYAPVGLLRGALAGVFNIPTTFTSDNSVAHAVGLSAVQSARNVNSTLGVTCYVLRVERSITVASMTVMLTRFVNGIVWQGTPAPLWSASITPPIALGTNFTLEFEWEVSAEYGGTRLIVRRGSATNYSDLFTMVDMIHPLAPLPTESLGEGPCLMTGATTTVNFSCLIDQWRLRA